MPTAVVMAVYGGAVVLAVLLLFLFRAHAWYWHALSVVAAIAIGLAPIPASLRSTSGDLIIGAVVLFLFIWGVLAPAFGDHHKPRHGAPKHA
jgi:hypothetical protein